MADAGSTDAARLTTLARLDAMSIRRLARLLRHHDVEDAFDRVGSGRVGAEVVGADIAGSWSDAVAAIDLVEVDAELRELGVSVTSWHDHDHPADLLDDVDPAPVLFRLGTVPERDLPRVAIVGTRRCSGPGREIAYELGAALAEAGVVVVSGLAKGVDGAAHRGVVAARGAPPMAVVGSGPDVVYPKAHGDLWARVAETGCLISEAPPGARPEPWRFPARNRLIAAFADLLVVVESRATGGSLLTVEQAIRRGVEVMAVPGSVRNPAAAGTNQLLADGCAPVRGPDDVLMALGLSTVDRTAKRTREQRLPKGDAATVLSAIDGGRVRRS